MLCDTYSKYREIIFHLLNKSALWTKEIFLGTSVALSYYSVLLKSKLILHQWDSKH